MENENDVADIENTAEEVDLNSTTEEVESEETTESIDELRTRLAKAEEIAESQKIRAEKAEKLVKTKAETKVEAHNDTSLSSKDTIALINAKVHEDDVEDVIDYAKYKKISVAEALKSSVIKASLAEKSEFRATANATNTAKARSGGSKASGDTLLDKAKRTGEVPDSDEGLNALVAARYSKKK